MSRRRFFAFWMAFAILLVSHVDATTEGRKESGAIASVDSDAAKPGVFQRAVSILREHHIEAIGVGSKHSYSAMVLTGQAREARVLLAKAVKREGLDVTLIRYNSKTKRFDTLTPDAVLKEARSAHLRTETIAIFQNRPEAATKLDLRISDILEQHYISCEMGGSLGISVDVDAEEAELGRLLLAKAVKEEGLPLRLVEKDPKQKGSVTVTPDEILAREKAKSAATSEWEFIAFYPHPLDEVVKRIGDILGMPHFRVAADGGPGMTFSVGKAHAEEARVKLAEAIQAEHLEVTLYRWDPEAGQPRPVTPEEVLEKR